MCGPYSGFYEQSADHLRNRDAAARDSARRFRSTEPRREGDKVLVRCAVSTRLPTIDGETCKRSIATALQRYSYRFTMVQLGVLADLYVSALISSSQRPWSVYAIECVIRLAEEAQRDAAAARAVCDRLSLDFDKHHGVSFRRRRNARQGVPMLKSALYFGLPLGVLAATGLAQPNQVRQAFRSTTLVAAPLSSPKCYDLGCRSRIGEFTWNDMAAGRLSSQITIRLGRRPSSRSARACIPLSVPLC